MSEVWKTYSVKELENQIACSRWPAKRNEGKPPDKITADYFELSTLHTLQNREILNCDLDILYGTNDRQKIDVYGTELPQNAPILFWIHGGYWQIGSKLISGNFAYNVHEFGIRLVTLGYTIAPAAKIQDMQKEVIQGLKKAMELYPDAKFIVGGHSAGGHLAAQLLHNDTLEKSVADRIDGLFLVSGIYDLRPLVSTYVNDPLKMTMCDAVDLSPLLKKVSSNFTNKKPRVIFIYGCKESMEFKRQSIMYDEELKKNGFSTDIIPSEEDDHFTLVEDLVCPTNVSGNTLINFLKSFK